MPGAPNRPPETAAAPVPVPDKLERKVLRRIAPVRVVLRLDLWKGAPSKDLLEPFSKAEAQYALHDYREADSALDQLSVRLAEPRWPTIPEPFKRLRVSIPAPMPPHYDPEFSLAPEERERRKERRDAELQLALANGVVAWAAAHGIESSDWKAAAESAGGSLARDGAGPEFWAAIDGIWTQLRERVPLPSAPAARAAPPPPTPDPG